MSEQQRPHLADLAHDQRQELAALGATYLVAPPPSEVSLWTRFRSFIWDSDTHLKSKEERRFLLKLDVCVLTTLCLGWFCKYLDQSNLSNAYISGMKEDLNFQGNDYNYLSTIFTIVYAVMQVPSTVIISKVRPSYWLFICELGWGAFTLAQAGAQNVHTTMALRACVAFFEASFFPCGLLMLGSWYGPSELAKRTAIFHMTAAVGSSFAGNLMIAVRTHLAGIGGLEGWRWLYIVCGAITIPCAACCLFLLPDYPHNTRAWYLNETDIAIANARAAKHKKEPIRGNFTWATWKRVLRRWEFYAFVLLYIFFGQSCQAAGNFGIWLKFKGASVTKRNLFPTFINYVEIPTIFLWGFLSDYFQSRYAFVAIPMVLAQFPLAVLAISPEIMSLMEAAFILCGVYLITSIIYSWANESLASDPEARALTVSSMNGFQYAMNAWMSIVLFPQTSGPRWKAGFAATWAWSLMALFIATGIWYAQRQSPVPAPPVAEDPQTTSATLEEKTDGDLGPTAYVTDSSFNGRKDSY